MDLLEVDCGNGVERGLLNTPRPQPASLSLGMAKSKCNLSPLYLLSLPPSSCGSAVGCCNERWLVANCDLCGGGFGCAGRGPVEAKRWIRGRTEGDNLITAFYLLSSSSSTLAGSLAPSPTSCHYGNPEPCKKTSATVGTERRPGGQRRDGHMFRVCRNKNRWQIDADDRGWCSDTSRRLINKRKSQLSKQIVV